MSLSQAQQERVDNAIKHTQKEISNAVDYISTKSSDIHQDLREKQQHITKDYVNPLWQSYSQTAIQRPIITTFVTAVVLLSILPVLTFISFSAFVLVALIALSTLFVAVTAAWIVGIAFAILLGTLAIIFGVAVVLTSGFAFAYLSYQYFGHLRAALRDQQAHIPKDQRASVGINAGLAIQTVILGTQSFIQAQWEDLLNLVDDVNEQVPKTMKPKSTTSGTAKPKSAPIPPSATEDDEVKLEES